MSLSALYVGEQWIIYTQLDSICFDICYNSGTTTLQNIHYYGGAVNWMGAANYNSGALVFNHLYCGPPPYQPDRVITCNEGWAMSLSSRGSLTVTDCMFLGTWDDVFDRGCDSDDGVVPAGPESGRRLRRQRQRLPGGGYGRVLQRCTDRRKAPRMESPPSRPSRGSPTETGC